MMQGTSDTEYAVNPNIKNLYRVKPQGSRRNALRLDMNENPIGLPTEFVSEVKRKITPQFLSMYPEKERLTKLLAEYHHISDNNLSITSGSDEAIRLAFQCFGQQKKQALTVSPTFEMYDVYSKMFGMEHITADYHSDFTISLENVLSKISDKTNIIVLLNPNSPIGTCWSEQDARSIIEMARGVGAVVIVDEAYHYFCQSTFMPLIQEYDNLMVLRTFSKLYSCAGLRIGYMAGHERLIHYIENASATFNVNSVAILFAEELMMHPEICKELIAIERRGREWLIHKFSSTGRNVLRLEGNYILFKPFHPSGEVVAKLKAQNVLVRDYSSGILKGWIRVSTGSKECMEQFWTVYSLIDK